MSSEGEEQEFDNFDMEAYLSQAPERENAMFYEDDGASPRNNSDDADIVPLPTQAMKPVFSNCNQAFI